MTDVKHMKLNASLKNRGCFKVEIITSLNAMVVKLNRTLFTYTLSITTRAIIVLPLNFKEN